METTRPAFAFLKKTMPRPAFKRLAPAYHAALAFFAALRYGFPSRRLVVIGVTGTNGKTTVVHLLHEIFRAAGFGVASASSQRFKVNDAEEPNLMKMTMPGRGWLQRFLGRCRREGCRYAILEVTSEGIAQSRHRFVRFAGAVLTNVRPEHIESHGGFERYRQAKIELFRRLPQDGFAILNREDESAPRFAEATAARVAWYSSSAIDVPGVGYPVRMVATGADRLELEVGGVLLESRLGGHFNAMNALAAAAAGLAFGVSLAVIADALRRFPGVPGRLEFVQRKPFAVVVDYAVTPDALEAVYIALSGGSPKSDLRPEDVRPSSVEGFKSRETRNSKLVCVFGAAGGGRDKWKRPKLGKIAGEFCKAVILTSDDPDDEDPTQIVSEIRSGMTSDQLRTTETILDRREAIREALRAAKPGDTVIITGMGAQPWFVAYGGKKIPWDERAVVREELTKLQ